MTTNAPVQATIIAPHDVQSLCLIAGYSWTWSDREHVAPPSADEIFDSLRHAFSSEARSVTFMVAHGTDQTHKMIDFIEGIVTGVRYESGASGMLLVELKSEDPRWTKVHGFYDCRPDAGAKGWLSLTPRR